jgi:hypothetical protein
MLVLSALLVSASTALADVPVGCEDLDIAFRANAVAAEEADQALQSAQSFAQGEVWMYENLDNLWHDHESLMEEREELYREFLVVSPTPEMEQALAHMDVIEQDIWNQITWYEQKIGAMDREIYRAQRRSDRAYAAAEEAKQQLNYCIEEAPPATPNLSVTRP